MSFKFNVLKGKKVIDGNSKFCKAGKQLGFYQQFCNELSYKYQYFPVCNMWYILMHTFYKLQEITQSLLYTWSWAVCAFNIMQLSD